MFLMTSIEKGRGLHVGATHPCPLVPCWDLHLPPTETRKDSPHAKPLCLPGLRSLPHLSLHLLFHSLTNNKTLASGSFFLCI